MTVQDPVITRAVPGTKNKASVYNTNFDNMVQYVKDCMDGSVTYVQEQLTTYAEINTLSTQGTIELDTNTINTITPDGAVTFTLPTITGDDAGKYHQILVQIHIPETPYTINLGTNYYFNSNAPSLTTSGDYNLIYEYDNINSHWVVGAISKGTV